MTNKVLTILAGSAIVATIGCTDKTDDTSTTTAPGTSTPGTSTPGTTSTSTPGTSTSYSSYDGWHSFDYSANAAAGEAGSGSYDCALVWWATGTPAGACSDCEFSFDVSMDFDDWEYSYDNGDLHWCGQYAADMSVTMALYDTAYGLYMTYYASGYFYPWAAAEFSGGKVTYSYGWTDYYYYGYYYSYAVNGGADVQ